MNHSLRNRITARSLAALALGLASCSTAPLDRNAEGEYPNHNAPAGRIEGTVLYEGPPPALDANGTPLGRVILLLFRANNGPPPDGLATTAESVQAIPASQLFLGATAIANGRVRASMTFVFPSIERAGEYQLRAFYSARDEREGFHPLYGVRSQPVKGDVAGGAVADPTDVAAPRFVPIGVGRPTSTATGTAWTMPETGAVTRGVTVFLGLPVREDRPVFRVASEGIAGFMPIAPTAPPPAPMRADWAAATGMLSSAARVLTFPSNLPAGVPDDLRTIASALPAFTIQSGVVDGELPAVRNAGVPFDNAALQFTLGPAYRPAHPTLLPVPVSPTMSAAVPWIFPLVFFVKLHDPDATERAALASPSTDAETLARLRVALNQPERERPVLLVGTAAPESGLPGVFAAATAPMTSRAARVVLSPIALEPQPDGSLSPIAPKLPPGLAAALARLRPDIRCTDAGLPAGRYAITLVTRAGQTWSLPNELSPWSGLADPRIAVPSQGAVVRIAPAPAQSGYVCPTAM